MGTPAIPSKAALVVSVVYRQSPVRDEALRLLAGAFGPGTLQDGVMAFDQTAYYSAEMGAPLSRVMWMAHALFGRNRLAGIKVKTNEIEKRLAKRTGERRVNLDPGLLTAENFILATTKNYTHRIYLKKGIFADLTLMYRKGEFTPLEWTYPDYAGAEIRNLLKTWRNTYIKVLRERKKA